MQITIEQLAAIVRGLRAELPAVNTEYDRALAEVLRDAVAAAGGEYLIDGPSLDTVLAYTAQLQAEVDGNAV